MLKTNNFIKSVVDLTMDLQCISRANTYADTDLMYRMAGALQVFIIETVKLVKNTWDSANEQATR